MPLGRATGYLTRPLAALALAGLVAAAASQGAVRAQARPPVTFNRDVAPILYANCTTCHRPGESGAIQPVDLRGCEAACRLDFRRDDQPRHAAVAARVGGRRVRGGATPGAAGNRHLPPVGGGWHSRRAARGSSRCSDLYRWLAARRARRDRQHARPIRRSGRRPRRLSKLRAAHSVDRAPVCARDRVPAGQCARPAPCAHSSRRLR